MNTDTTALLGFFLEYVLLFPDDNEDEEFEKFSSRKSSASE